MKEVIYDAKYRGMDLSTTWKSYEGYNSRILSYIIDFLNYAMGLHSRPFFIRIGLNLPSRYVYNAIDLRDRFETFINTMSKASGRKNYRPLYFWVKEYSEEGRPHYHLVFIFDGNLTQNGWGFKAAAEKEWWRVLRIVNYKGLVQLYDKGEGVEYGGFMIRRYNEDAAERYNLIFRHLSYYAKVCDKQRRFKGERLFGGSTIPIRNARSNVYDGDIEWETYLQNYRRKL